MNDLAAWNNFYVIIGSAAGALIGLQFVAMTLLADRPVRNVMEAGMAFSTPTIVHFCAALLLSALTCIPWQSMIQVAVAWGLVGICGVVYAFIVLGRMQRQKIYKPVIHDWLYYGVLPLVGYSVVTVSAAAASCCPFESLLGVAASVLLLLIVGIHNSWDAVTYHIFTSRPKSREDLPKP